MGGYSFEIFKEWISVKKYLLRLFLFVIMIFLKVAVLRDIEKKCLVKMRV